MSILKVKKIKPLFTNIITTMDKYEQDVHTEGGLIDNSKQKDTLKEYQTVLAVGSSVRDIKEGDLVCINPTRFEQRKHSAGSLKNGVVTDNPVVGYNFDIVEMDDKQCLLLQDRDISFVISEYEEVEEQSSKSVVKESKLID